MCKYCKTDKLGDGWGELSRVRIKGLKRTVIEATSAVLDGKELLTAVTFCDDTNEKRIKINYCPMCGRKLDD